MFSKIGSFTFNSAQTVLELDFAAMDRLFNINVRGTTACVKHASRVLVDMKIKGSIICMTSTGASSGGERDIDYQMSKQAVIGLVRSASKQLGVNGIRVNNASPFVVATPLLCSYTGTDAEEAERVFEPYSKLKGVGFKAKHVADAVLFLASDDSELITGHDLVVDASFLVK